MPARAAISVIERVVSAQMEGVYFPVTIREFGAHLVFKDLREESLQFGPVKVDTMLLSHPGYCLGYRLTYRLDLRGLDGDAYTLRRAVIDAGSTDFRYSESSRVAPVFIRAAARSKLGACAPTSRRRKFKPIVATASSCSTTF